LRAIPDTGRPDTSDGLAQSERGESVMRWLVVMVGLVLAGCGPQAADCGLTMVAQLPIQVQAHLLTVPIGLNGKWARMIVDTGAERTTVSERAADRLGLPTDQRFITHSVGIGGAASHADATLSSMVIGGVRFPVERIAVGTLNFDGTSGLTADGLLGADILLAFEMDIDVPQKTLTLYRVRRCPGAKPNWSEPAVEVTGITSRKDRMLIPFSLDGVAGLAVLDTGAQASVIGVDMAHRMGLTEESMVTDPIVRHRGAGPGLLSTHLHQFRALRIGPAVVEQPNLSVLPTPAGFGDALVGEDFLAGRRVWLSFPTRQLFVSPLTHEVAAVP
jgi:predicted aspartyl protease